MEAWERVGESPAYWGGARSEWTLERQRALHAKWKIIHARHNLDGHNFSGQSLCGADLGFLSLEGANFNGADLRYANFGASLLYGATFVGAKLCNADFIDAELVGTDFSESDLTDARMPDGSIYSYGGRWG